MRPKNRSDHSLDVRLEPLRQRRSRRLQGPDAGEWRFEVEVDVPDWLAPEVAAESLVFANNGRGDYLYLNAAAPGVMAFLHEGAESVSYCATIEDLLPDLKRPPSDHGPIQYHGTSQKVEVGHRVFVRYWLFFKGEGVVSYVPGRSPLNRSLERDGLAWVRTRLDDGAVVETIVLEGVLKKGVTFLSTGEVAAEG